MRKEIIVFSSFFIWCYYLHHNGIEVEVSCFSDQNYAQIVSRILELFGDHVTLEKWAEFWTKKQLASELFKNSPHNVSKSLAGIQLIVAAEFI